MNDDQKFHFELGFHHAREEATKIAERKAQNCFDSCVQEAALEIQSMPLPEGIK